MLSICIPVFNYNVDVLVNSLARQAASLQVASEIVVIDDASDDLFRSENKYVRNIAGVKYIELDSNLGRSKIRNLFLQNTAFEYLLFIDCDAETNNPLFLQNYLNALNGHSVIVGGVAYSKNFPGKEFSLRWHYGHQRESTNADFRIKEPYKSFKTFNFAVPRKVFEKIHFDENISGYGHEDTLFGLALKQQGINIIHIENPLIHAGLETNQVFLKKTRQGIDNLVRLGKDISFDSEFVDSIRLLKVYMTLNSFTKTFIKIVFILTQPLIIFMLKLKTPNMKVFDFYKLGYLVSTARNPK